MFQAVAAVSGGMWLKQKLDDVPWPHLRRAVDPNASFRLSVRVVSASAPGLGSPGILAKQRPFLEVAVGDSSKQTEIADFSRDKEGSKVCGGEPDFPWRFGDTISFKTRLQDVLGSDLRLTLRSRSDVVMGPVQLELQAAEVGTAILDLRNPVLSNCVEQERDLGNRCWDSPTTSVPLYAPVKNLRDALKEGNRPFEVVGHVAVIFSVDTDPEDILAAVGPPRKSVADVKKKVGERMEGAMQWLGKPIDSSRLAGVPEPPSRNKPVGELPQPESEPESVCGGSDVCLDPELAPDGWVRFSNPNGRTFWHHVALGPAPWEAMPDKGMEADVLPRAPLDSKPHKLSVSSANNAYEHRFRREPRDVPVAKEPEESVHKPVHSAPSAASPRASPERPESWISSDPRSIFHRQAEYQPPAKWQSHSCPHQSPERSSNARPDASLQPQEASSKPTLPEHRSSGPREDEDLARWSYLQRCRREAALGNSDVHGAGAPVHVSV